MFDGRIDQYTGNQAGHSNFETKRTISGVGLDTHDM